MIKISFNGEVHEFASEGKSYIEILSSVDPKLLSSYVAAKVGEAVIETLRPIREEATRLLKDKAYLEGVYRSGAERASYEAEKTLRKVYKKIGFLAR